MQSVLTILALSALTQASFHGAREEPVPCLSNWSTCDGSSSINICDRSIEGRSHELTCAEVLNVPAGQALCVEPTVSMASCVPVSTTTTPTTTTTTTSSAFHGATQVTYCQGNTWSTCDGSDYILKCDSTFEGRAHDYSCADILALPSGAAVCVEPTKSAASCVPLSTTTTTSTTTSVNSTTTSPTTTTTTTTSHTSISTGCGSGSASGSGSGSASGSGTGSGSGSSGSPLPTPGTNGTLPGSGNPGHPGQPITPTSSHPAGPTGTGIVTGAADAIRASWLETLMVGAVAVAAGGAIVL